MGGARLLHGLLPARGSCKMKRDNEVPHGFTEEVKEVKSLLIRHLVRAEVQQEALQGRTSEGGSKSNMADAFVQSHACLPTLLPAVHLSRLL